MALGVGIRGIVRFLLHPLATWQRGRGVEPYSRNICCQRIGWSSQHLWCHFGRSDNRSQRDSNYYLPCANQNTSHVTVLDTPDLFFHRGFWSHRVSKGDSTSHYDRNSNTVPSRVGLD